MSRCFPYPPPGYERNGTRNEALFESIKLEREREKVKKDRRKEKKREKKEKENPERKREKKEKENSERKREKKEKEKPRKNGEIENKGHKHEKGLKGERSNTEQKGAICQKKRDDETEQLEKSSITEECGQPVNSQNLYDSSDSTQNSNKRKRNCLPSDGSHNYGSVIRIRLLLQKHKDPAASPSTEQASTSGRSKNVVQDDHEITPRISKEQPCSTSGTAKFVGREQPCSTLGSAEILTQFLVKTAPPTFSSGSDDMLPIESQYSDLLENWVPPPIRTELRESDDQEWLFETSGVHKQEAKRFKASSDVLLCNGSSSLWPRACYLPEADIHALPYTVPF